MFKRKYIMQKYKSSNEYFIYESNSSSILKVDQVIYNLIYGLLNYSVTEFIERYKNNKDYDAITLKRVYEKFLPIKKQVFINTEELNIKLIKNNTFKELQVKEKIPIKKMTISLTEDCNLRCSYCFYSEKYTESRNHSTRKLDLFKIKKAVDKFLNECDKSGSTIGFYGGEPLLEIENIKTITRYIKSKRLKIDLSITTNGVLLNYKTIDFLIENDFNISISMDVTKNLHDKNRHTSTGKPTYEIIMSNINKIKDKYPEYYKHRLQIISTIDPDDLFFAVNLTENSDLDFILTDLNENDEKLKERILKNFKKRHDVDVVKERNEYLLQLNEFLLKFDKKIINRNYVWKRSFYDKVFLSQIIEVYKRTKDFNFMLPKGSCIPIGLNGLYVNADGDLYPCAKLDYDFKIGNLDNWIDKEYSSNIIKRFTEFKIKNCLYCWAKNICGLCFVRFVDNHEFKLNKALCLQEKINTLNKLKLYSHLLTKYKEFELIDFIEGLRKP